MLTHGVKYGAGTSIFESASKDSYFQLRFLVTSILINDLESRCSIGALFGSRKHMI